MFDFKKNIKKKKKKKKSWGNWFPRIWFYNEKNEK